MEYSEVNEVYGMPKKSHKGLILTIIFFVVVLVAIGGIFYYKLSSINSFKLLLEYTFNSLENGIDDAGDQKSFFGDFSVKLDLKSADATDNEIFGLFNKLDLSGTYGIDYDKSIISLDFYSQYDEEELLNMSLYTEYGKAYIYLNNLYDKYIETSLDDYNSLFERNLDDSKVIVSSVKKALLESLKDDYFEKEKADLDSVKVTKTTLILNKENYQEFENSFIQMLLDDHNFMESLANVTDQEVSELKKSFEEKLNEEIDSEEEMILYTKGSEFVQFEANDGESRIVVKKDDSKYQYEFYENGKLLYDGIVQITEKGKNTSVVVSYDDKEEQVGFELTFDSSLNKNGKVETKDITNAISYEKMTEDDVMSIYSKLLENDGIVKIIEEISKLSGEDVEDSSTM